MDQGHDVSQSGEDPVTLIYRDDDPSPETLEYQHFKEWIKVTMCQSPEGCVEVREV